MRKIEYAWLMLPVLVYGCAVVSYRVVELPRLSETTRATRTEISGNAYYQEHFIIPLGFFKNNHGPSIAELDRAGAIITWFAGSQEGSRDAQIFAVRYNSDGSYSVPRMVVRAGERIQDSLWEDKSVGNTALFRDSENNLWLFYNVIPFGGWSSAVVNYKVSRDNGNTWTEAKRFVSWWGNLIRNKPVALGPETFVIPLYTELFGHKGYSCMVRHKNGQILSQECGNFAGKEGAIQPAIVSLGENKLVAFFRDKGRENVFRAGSQDGGFSWTEPEPTNLPNPDSAVAALALGQNEILLVYNNSRGERTPLSLALSKNGGKSFCHIKSLENAEGSYAYPEIIQTSDGKIHVVYSYRRESIKHVVFNKEWLFSGFSRGC